MVQGLVESVSTLNWVILMLLAQHWRTSPYIDWLWWVHRFVQRGFPLFCCLDCATGFWGSKIWCSYAGSKIWCTHRLIDIPPILRLTCGFENVFKPLLLRKIRGHSMPGISLRLCLVMYSFAVCYLDEVAPHWQMWLRQWTSMDHKNKVGGEWGSRLKPCDVRFTASCGLQWCIFGLDWLRAVFWRLGGLELVAVKIAGRCLPYSIFIDIYIYIYICVCVYMYMYIYIYIYMCVCDYMLYISVICSMLFIESTISWWEMSQDKLKPIHWARAKAQSLRSCTAWCRLSRWSRALRSCRFLSRALGPTDVDWLGFVRIIWKLLSFIMLVLNMLHIYIYISIYDSNLGHS